MARRDEFWWIPKDRPFDYTKERQKWVPNEKALIARLRARSIFRRMHANAAKAQWPAMAFRVYLDNCTLGRPEDSATGRVGKQAQGVLRILAGIRRGEWELVKSTMHYAEAERLRERDPFRYDRVIERLNLAGAPVCDSSLATSLYRLFRQVPRGKAPLLKPGDGLHLASAVLYGAAVMVTVDRKLYLWARVHQSLLRGLQVMRPGEFLGAFEHGQAGPKSEEE